MRNQLEDFVSLADKAGLPSSLVKRARALKKKGVLAFGTTDVLAQKISEMTRANPREASTILGQVFDLIFSASEALLKIPKGPRRAVEAHKMIAEAIERADRSPEAKADGPSPCRKGCSFCCHIVPYVAESEGDLISAYVKSKKLFVDLPKIKAQALADGPLQYELLPWQTRACAFLGKDGACQIYSVRPSTCRKHTVVGSPTLCDTRVSDTAMIIMRVEVEAIAAGFLNIELTGEIEATEPLPRLMLRKLI